MTTEPILILPSKCSLQVTSSSSPLSCIYFSFPSASVMTLLLILKHLEYFEFVWDQVIPNYNNVTIFVVSTYVVFVTIFYFSTCYCFF